MTPSISVVAPLWQDRPGSENLEVARTAVYLGYGSMWVGEMATYDAFSLATAIGLSHDIDLTIGPLAVGVRTAINLAMGVASVSDLIQRPTRLAIGASSPVVVGGWHGREWRNTITHIEESAGIVRAVLEGGRSDHSGALSRSHGYRLRLDPPGCHMTVAAFGRRTVAMAARVADRIVLNMVTSSTAARLVAQVKQAAVAAGRDAPPVAVWLVASVDPTVAARRQMAMARVGYLAAPGYGGMLTEAGFGALVELARSGAHPAEIARSIPPELDDATGLVGSPARLRERVAEYGEAGVSEICVVPVTADDPGGRGCLEVLATG